MPSLKTNASFLYQSDPGDFIGQGKSYSYSSALEEEVTFTALVHQQDKKKNYVRISIEKKMQGENDHWWTLEFAAPKGQQLKKGTYKGATRCAFHADNEPGLTMSGCGRGANRTHGEFTIQNIRFSKASELMTLSASFICRNTGFSDPSKYESLPAVRGDIYFYKKATTAKKVAA